MSGLRSGSLAGEALETLRAELSVVNDGIPVDELQDARRRFPAVLERPQSVGLSLRWEDTFVQFGPAIVDERVVMLPSCVTNGTGTSRGGDYLGPLCVPHVTLGKFADGMGRIRAGDDGVEWHVSGPSTPHPQWGTAVWDQSTRHIVPIQQLVDDVSRELLAHRCFERPLPCRVRFESSSCRWVLDEGVAVDVCRVFREVLCGYGRTQHVCKTALLSLVNLSDVLRSRPHIIGFEFRIGMCFGLFRSLFGWLCLDTFSAAWCIGCVRGLECASAHHLLLCPID